VSYLFNIRIAMLGWFPGNVAHFWSLAVEEQFYLLWPLLVLFAPRRLLFPLSLAMVILGPLSRVLALAIGLYGPALSVLTPSCFDALGLGAALAIASGGGPAPRELVARLMRLALPIGLLIVVVLDVLVSLNAWRYAGHLYIVLYDTATALVFCWLVAMASTGFSGITGRFLRFGPVAYCGHIAYGIYVYHLLLAQSLYQFGVWLGLGWQWGDYPFFVSKTKVSNAISRVT
jgi:peptidoglycan/LPS O-acetylase OafA/YrhL